MKVIIAGSRSLIGGPQIRVKIKKVLDFMDKPITAIISGTANGVDKIGETYARANNIELIEMPADWTRYGKSAGPIRNRKMAELADFAIVFWDGESKGSKNMISEMSRLNKPCYIEIIRQEDEY